MLHKAWIKLHHWPVLCWNREDVLVAICGFGALWEVDEATEAMQEVSFYRVNVRCRHVQTIPESFILFVEDRRFDIQVEVESWEDADRILLGEALDKRLGLDSAEAQEAFIRCTGFSAFQGHGGSQVGVPAGELGRRRLLERPVHEGGSLSNFNPLDFPPLPPYPEGALRFPYAIGGASDDTSSAGVPATDPTSGVGPVNSAGGDSSLLFSGAGPYLRAQPSSLLGPPSWDPPLLGPTDTAPLGLDSSPSAQPGLSLSVLPAPAAVGSLLSSPVSSSLGGLDPPLSVQPESSGLIRPASAVAGSGSSLGGPGSCDPVGLGPSPSAEPSDLVHQAPAASLSARRSIRLAAKYLGNNLLTLQRAQALKRKKVISAGTSKLAGASRVAAHSLPSPSTADGGRPVGPSGSRDPASPLTKDEVSRIKAACGIFDPVESHPPCPRRSGKSVVLACPAPSGNGGV